MAKVEIEIPTGKVADVSKDGDKVVVTFKEENLLNIFKDTNSVKNYIEKIGHSGIEWALDLWNEYMITEQNSYSEKICLYRMVVAALTNNEECHLTTGERWYPIVQFCKPGKEEECWGSKIIGMIESEGQKYTVMGGRADYCGLAGLGCFLSYWSPSPLNRHVGFLSVSSKEIAEHISKYFGKLLFEIQYGGTNCDWKWL